MNSIDCTKRKVEFIIARSDVPEDPAHAQNTLDWLLLLKPTADNALVIAAFAHDIERAINSRKVLRANFPDYEAFKAAHARNSAEIVKKIMHDCDVPQDIAGEVYRLISLHEVGGDPRSDLIKNADSVSFFEVNLPLYFERHGWEESVRRSIWGYRRLSPRMREVVRSFLFENEQLNALVQDTIKRADQSLKM